MGCLWVMLYAHKCPYFTSTWRRPSPGTVGLREGSLAALLHLVLHEAGQGAHVAQVEAGVAAGEAAEVAGLVRLGRGHVVVDPHPPARVQRGQVLGGNS